MFYLIAGLSIRVEDVLSALLPQRMNIFSQTVSDYCEPLLHVKVSKRLFSSITNENQRLLLHQWRECQISTLYLPDSGELLMEEAALDGSVDPVALQFGLMQSIRTVIGLLLLRQGGFIVHAAAVATPDHTLLFSGLSGAGKSTQALLWEKYGAADVINHDAPMITCCNGRFYCHGNPWSGSVDCYKQTSSPVDYLLALSHGQENRLMPLDEKAALRFMLTQSLVRLQTDEDMALLVENMQRFVQTVPMFHYACLPNRSAVYTLQNHLTSQEDTHHA